MSEKNTINTNIKNSSNCSNPYDTALVAINANSSVNLSPLHNFSQYLETINSFKLLSQQEERELAEKVYYQNDLFAAQKLVLHSLRFVIPVARKFRNYGLSEEDLVQEGNIGLIKAVKKFDPNKGVRVVTFALHWIKAEITEFIIKNWKIVKVATTKAQRKLFFKLRGMKNSLKWLELEDARKIANNLNLSEKDVMEMDKRLYLNNLDIDSPTENDEIPQIELVSSNLNPEDELLANEDNYLNKNKLTLALKTLDARSLRIIQSRWLSDNKLGLKELSKELGVSMERIRQVEVKAISQLKKYMLMGLEELQRVISEQEQLNRINTATANNKSCYQ